MAEIDKDKLLNDIADVLWRSPAADYGLPPYAVRAHSRIADLMERAGYNPNTKPRKVIVRGNQDKYPDSPLTWGNGWELHQWSLRHSWNKWSGAINSSSDKFYADTTKFGEPTGVKLWVRNKLNAGTATWVQQGSQPAICSCDNHPTGILLYTGKASDLPVPREAALDGMIETLRQWAEGDVYVVDVEDAATGELYNSLCGIYGYKGVVDAVREMTEDYVVVAIKGDAAWTIENDIEVVEDEEEAA